MTKQILFILTNSLALGMFVQACFLYMDYVYGFEYGMIVYGVILTSLVLSMLRPQWAGKSIKVWVYASSVSIGVFGMLTEVSTNNHVLYFTLLCAAIIFCALLLGFVLQSQDQCSRISIIIPGVIVGLYTAYHLVLELDSVFSVVLLAAAIIVLSVVFSGQKLKTKDFLTITSVVLVLLILSNMLVKSQIPAWVDKYATKPTGNYLLQDDVVNTGDVDWSNYGRVDRVAVFNKDQEIAYFWQLISGNAATPFSANINLDIAASSRKYPLLTLPLKASKPENILIVGEQNPVTSAIKDSSASHIDLLVLSDNNQITGGKYFPTLVAKNITKINDAGTKYELIHISAPVEVNNTWLHGSLQGMVFLQKEMLDWYLDQLSYDGVLAIVVKDEVVFSQVLVNLWDLMAKENTGHVNKLSRNLNIYKLNKYANNRGVYDYLILASGTSIPDKVASRMEEEVKKLPVEVVIYNNNTANQPYNIISSRNLDIEKSILQLRRYLSHKLGLNINLDGSSVWRPSLYNITNKPHPYLIAIFTLAMLASIYGVVISKNSKRIIANPVHYKAPAASVLLLQSMASIVIIVILAMIHIMLSTASFGMDNMAIVNTVSILLIGYYLSNYFEWMLRALRLNDGRSARVVLLISLLVSLGWFYLSALEMPRLLMNSSYWLMSFLLLTSAVVTGYLHRCVMHKVKAIYPELETWSTTLTGIGVLQGVLIFLWLLMGADMKHILIYTLMLYTYLLFVHFWLSRATDVYVAVSDKR